MRWLRTHGWDLFFILVLAVLIVFFEVRGSQRDADDRRDAVTACQRGNVIRDFLAFDNNARIVRLETGLADPLTPGKLELRAEYERRLGFVGELVPFPCEELR